MKSGRDLVMVLMLIGALGSASVMGQLAPPPTGGGLSQGGGNTGRPPDPLIINGRAAEEMKPEEIREFLTMKVREAWLEDGDVELLHVSVGYPVVLRFNQTVQAVSVGDPELFRVEKMGRMVEVVALQPEGDTPLRVFFAGDKVYYFHAFARATYLEGDAIVTVNGGADGAFKPMFTSANGEGMGVSEVLRTVANYDILLQERAINPRRVNRSEIFGLRSAQTGFTVYYRYNVEGVTVYTFRYDNPFQVPRVLDRSRLRFRIANLDFIPDYVSLSRTDVGPGGNTMGVALFWKAPFDLKAADKEGVWMWKPRAVQR
jgi:hypothetical protein